MEKSIAGKGFLLVAANQLASSPRLLKMMEYLQEHNAKVSVIYLETFHTNYPFDEEIIQRNPDVSFYKVSKLGSNLWSSLKMKVLGRVALLCRRYKLFNLFERFHPFNSLVKGLNLENLGKINYLIAFNFDSLPVGANIAKRLHAKLYYDIEDLYAYIGTNWDSSIALIEQHYYHKADALLLASPFFKDVILTDFQREGFVVRNVFDSMPQIENSASDGLVKLVWFSQTIGLDRGLQDIIAALDDITFRDFRLTIIGNCSTDVRQTLCKVGPDANARGQILFRPLMGYYDLGPALQGFDVGLSLERADSLNRNLCEVNKGFQYLSAGIPFILSNTIAQRAFHLENKGCSFVYEMGNIKALQHILTALAHPGQISKLKEAARKSAARYNYAEEMQGILAVLVQ